MDNPSNHLPFTFTNVRSIILQQPIISWGSALILAEFQAWGYDEINSGGTTCAGAGGSPTQSAAQITSAKSINVGNKYPQFASQPSRIEIPLTISSSDLAVPNLMVEVSLKKLSGSPATYATTSMNSIFSDGNATNPSQLQKTIITNQLTPEILNMSFTSLTNDGFNMFATPPANPLPSFTMQPYPDNKFNLKFIGAFRNVSAINTADYGSYQVVITIYEQDSLKSVGSVTYTFNLVNPYP